jgi:hypothetical protein
MSQLTYRWDLAVHVPTSKQACNLWIALSSCHSVHRDEQYFVNQARQQLLSRVLLFWQTTNNVLQLTLLSSITCAIRLGIICKATKAENWRVRRFKWQKSQIKDLSLSSGAPPWCRSQHKSNRKISVQLVAVCKRYRLESCQFQQPINSNLG